MRLLILLMVALSAHGQTVTFIDSLGNLVTAGDSVNNAIRINCITGCSGGGGGGVDITAVGGNAVTTTLPVSGTLGVTQSGTWTMQPGNAANTTPWLFTISQGGNAATVSGAGALKVDPGTVAVTGTFWQATQPVSGTVAATQSGTWNIGAVTTLPSITGTVTANAGTNLNTSLLALESGGNLASIVTNTANIPPLGQALAAASVPVVLTAAQLSTLTPPAAIAGFALETTLSTLNSKIPASPATDRTTAGGPFSLRLSDGSAFYNALTDTQLRATPVPVSASSLPLPSGAATEATLSTLNGKVTAVDTGAVVVASSALPTGAATAAKQPALGTAGTSSADVITVQGRAAMTPLLVDGSATTQPVSGTVTSNAGTGTFTVGQATGTNLHMVCDSGCTPGGSTADNSAFTFGTTALNPAGFVFDDASVNTVTENNVATPRMSANRVPYSMIRDAAGNERGANVSAGNALLVDASATTQPVSNAGTFATQVTSFPDNEPFNVSQINGVTPLMGAGNTGTGSLRVTLATDQAALPTWGMGATGAAPPVNAQLQGGLGSGATAGLQIAPTICDQWVAINGTASVQLIAGVSGRKIYVCSGNLQMNGGANTVSFVSGTGTVCATGITAVPGFDGATAAANGYSFAANSGMTWAGANGAGFARTTNNADNLCILIGTATRVVGGLSYAIY